MKKQLKELSELAPELCRADPLVAGYEIGGFSVWRKGGFDPCDNRNAGILAIAAITDWIKAQVFRLIITHEDGAVRWCLYYKPKWIYEVGVDIDEYKSNDEFEVAVKSAIAIAKWKKEKENE